MNIVEATFIQVKADFHMFVTIAAMAGKKKISDYSDNS